MGLYIHDYKKKSDLHKQVFFIEQPTIHRQLLTLLLFHLCSSKLASRKNTPDQDPNETLFFCSYVKLCQYMPEACKSRGNVLAS